MEFVDVLRDPGLGNLLIFITAIIGLIGSYWLYWQRTGDRRTTIRRALKKEIESNGVLDSWVRNRKSQSDPPAHVVQPTVVYRNVTNDLGLLTEEEVEFLTDFYSKAVIVNDIIKWDRESHLQILLKEDAVQRDRESDVQNINTEIDRLVLKRWKVVQILKKHLGEEYEPLKRMELPENPGDTVSKYHPAIYSFLDLLLEEGYIEEVDSDSDLVRLTESGSDIFSDEEESDQFDVGHGLSFT